MALKKKTTTTNTEELKAKATKNTTVTTKKANEAEVVVKEGAPKDHAPKHNLDTGKPNSTPKTAGISFGITKNMGSYESLRVDCWLTDELLEGETQKEALVRLGDIVQEQVEYEVDRILGA